MPSDIELREVSETAEALQMCPELDRYAAEIQEEFRDEPLPPGVIARFFERHFDASESLLLVAESEPGAADVGVCLVGPLEDPLSGERLPLILILHVKPDQRHRGVAARLVEAASRVMAGRGHTHFSCRAGHNDDALISMGERWGFVRQWDLMVRE